MVTCCISVGVYTDSVRYMAYVYGDCVRYMAYLYRLCSITVRIYMAYVSITVIFRLYDVCIYRIYPAIGSP